MSDQGELLHGLRDAGAKRAVALAAARSVAAVVGMVALYFALPLDRLRTARMFVWLPLALLGACVVVGFQVIAILRARFPGARAVEALGYSLPLFLLAFASTYFTMSLRDPASFTEPLTRMDSLYFAVTVFATVGFGDIAPRATDARVAVTLQMLTGLLLIGIGAKIILGAVRVRRTAPPT